MNKKSLIISNTKSNQNLIHSKYYQYGFNNLVQYSLDGLAFEIPHNYYIFMQNTISFRFDKYINDHYKDKKVINYLEDEFYDYFHSTNSIGKLIKKIQSMAPQLNCFSFLKLMNTAPKYKYTLDSYCSYVFYELKQCKVPFDSIHRLHFPVELYDTFNIVVDTVNDVGLPNFRRTGYPECIYDFISVNNSYLPSGMEEVDTDVNDILNRFLTQIGFIKNNHLTSLAQKISNPVNTIEMTRILYRSGKIKYKSAMPLSEIMNHLLSGARVIEKFPYFHNYYGLALAIKIMNPTIYHGFSNYYSHNGTLFTTSGESPLIFMISMLILLSKLMGVDSFKPTVKAIKALTKLDSVTDEDVAIKGHA